MVENFSDKKLLVRETAQLWRKIHRVLEEKEPSPWLRLNLSKGQLRILFLLNTSGQLSPGDIALRLGVPKANVTEIIERLVRQNLAKREPNHKDRRSHNLCLTEKGQNELENLRTWSTRRVERMFGGIPEEELKIISHSLNVMLEAAHSMTRISQLEEISR